MIEDVAMAHIELQAARWVRETFGNWVKRRRFNQTELECTWMAGFAAGLEHAAGRLKEGLGEPEDNDT